MSDVNRILSALVTECEPRADTDSLNVQPTITKDDLVSLEKRLNERISEIVTKNTTNVPTTLNDGMTNTVDKESEE